MRDPFLHKSLELRRVSPTKFGVFTTEQIDRGTLIESCAMLLLPKRVVTHIAKTPLADKLFPNTDGIIKEREIVSSIKEMGLEKRLDAGLLSPEDIKSILIDQGHLTQLLDIDTGCFLLGYGSLYGRSAYPNVAVSYDRENKLYDVVAVKDIAKGTELTYLNK